MRRTGRAAVVAVTALVMLISAAPVGAEEEGSEGAEAAAAEAEAPSEEQATDSTVPAEATQTAEPPEASDDSPPASVQDDAPPDSTAPAHEAPPSTEAAPNSIHRRELRRARRSPATTRCRRRTARPSSARGSRRAACGPRGAIGCELDRRRRQQTTTITGTAIAVATSGGNVSIATGSQSDDGDSQPAILGTGPASASGSRRRDQCRPGGHRGPVGGATADITQVVLVFNIGAALANSGLNVIGGAGTDGSQISTGSATAVGNDAASYMTQAATADASAGGSRYRLPARREPAHRRRGRRLRQQRGGRRGPGRERRRSDRRRCSERHRQPVAHRDRAARIRHRQWRRAPDDRAAGHRDQPRPRHRQQRHQHRARPRRLADQRARRVHRSRVVRADPAGAAGVGQRRATGPVPVGPSLSGDATAIGNRSETYIDQNAVATASGDGTASISQDVVVANVGAAVANTGANQLGSSASEPAALDAEGMRIATELGQFLTDLLEEIERWSLVPGGAPLNLALQLPFGDLVIGLDASVGGSHDDGLGCDIERTGDGSARSRRSSALASPAPTPGSTPRRCRSARATTSRRSRAAAAASGGSSITTGDASADNTSLVIVCQKDDAAALRVPAAGRSGDAVDPVDPVDPRGRSRGQAGPAVQGATDRVRSPSHRPGARATGATSASSSASGDRDRRRAAAHRRRCAGRRRRAADEGAATRRGMTGIQRVAIAIAVVAAGSLAGCTNDDSVAGPIRRHESDDRRSDDRNEAARRRTATSTTVTSTTASTTASTTVSTSAASPSGSSSQQTVVRTDGGSIEVRGNGDVLEVVDISTADGWEVQVDRPDDRRLDRLVHGRGGRSEVTIVLTDQGIQTSTRHELPRLERSLASALGSSEPAPLRSGLPNPGCRGSACRRSDRLGRGGR